MDHSRWRRPARGKLGSGGDGGGEGMAEMGRSCAEIDQQALIPDLMEWV